MRMRVASYRQCGFSLAKTEAIRGIAKAAYEERIPSRDQANSRPNAELIEILTSLRGVGKWTVEMLLIFSLGRLDVMPVDDYGVRAGLMHLYALDSMPKKSEFAARTDAWGPYRSIGAWYLWRLADEAKAMASEKVQTQG
jgi:DNA-3-methyladenine glycosylase II